MDGRSTGSKANNKSKIIEDIKRSVRRSFVNIYGRGLQGQHLKKLELQSLGNMKRLLSNYLKICAA